MRRPYTPYTEAEMDALFDAAQTGKSIAEIGHLFSRPLDLVRKRLGRIRRELGKGPGQGKRTLPPMAAPAETSPVPTPQTEVAPAASVRLTPSERSGLELRKRAILREVSHLRRGQDCPALFELRAIYDRLALADTADRARLAVCDDFHPAKRPELVE